MAVLRLWLFVGMLAVLVPLATGVVAAAGAGAVIMGGMTVFGFAMDLLGFYDMISSNEVQQRTNPSSYFDTKYFSAVPAGVPFTGFHGWQSLPMYKYEADFLDDDAGVSWSDCFLEIVSVSLWETEKGCSGEASLGATMAAVFAGYHSGSLTEAGAKAIDLTNPLAINGTYITSMGLVPKYVWVKAGASLNCKLTAGVPVNSAGEGENVLSLLTMSVSCTYGGTQGSSTTKSRSIQVYADGRVILGAGVGSVAAPQLRSPPRASMLAAFLATAAMATDILGI